MTDLRAAGAVSWRQRSRLVRAWRLLRTRRPRTFNDKVRYKMIRDHRPLIVTFADKAAVRGYIAERVGAEHLPVAYGVLSDPAELAALQLPEQYIVKPTHGSGAVLAVTPDAPPDAELPDPGGPWVCRMVRPDAVDPARLEALCAGWLERLHGHGPNEEWAYSLIPRRILVEELLTGADGGIPEDYKLFVFHGRCHYVQVDTGRFDRHTQDFFSPAWQHLALNGGLPQAAATPARPDRLSDMISIAERLGRDTDFVRVDFYLVPGRIIVGELTNYPAGGHSPFDPPSFNAEFGSHWTVPRRYR